MFLLGKKRSEAEFINATAGCGFHLTVSEGRKQLSPEGAGSSLQPRRLEEFRSENHIRLQAVFAEKVCAFSDFLQTSH